MNNSENRLSQMLDDDPVSIAPAAVGLPSDPLNRVKALRGRSAAGRTSPESAAADQEVARRTAEVLGWAKPGQVGATDAPAAKSRRRRRRDPNAEPVDVLYARVPRSAYQVFMRYCDDNDLGQAEGIVALTQLLPEEYQRRADEASSEQ